MVSQNIPPEEFTSIRVKQPMEAAGPPECETSGLTPAEIGKFSYIEAKQKADELIALLIPHCFRAEIAGSIRRKAEYVKDIEIVCVPKPYQTGLFMDGMAAAVSQFPKIKGEMDGTCKYTQRIIPMHGSREIKLDLFMTIPEKWGLIFAIRTGSAEFSKKLAARWVELGYHSMDGFLRYAGRQYPCYEEEDLFKRLGIPFLEPEKRM